MGKNMQWKGALEMNYDDLLALVKQRRSVRRFKKDSIPEDLIRKILDVAYWAPSGFNMQPWEFVVVRKSVLRQKIVEITGSYWQQSVEMETARPAWQESKSPMPLWTALTASAEEL